MIDLFEEEILKPKKKKQIKPIVFIIVAISLLVILLIVTLVSIVYLKGKVLKITLDGNDAKSLEKIFITEENNKIYIPIRRMAEYLQYSAYTGDYITRSEDDVTKCYIESAEQLVSFTLDSNIVTRVIQGQTQQIKIKEPIKEINGELCISSECSQDAFNLKFYHNVEGNTITIETLSFLYAWYCQQATNNGYIPLVETSYENKCAVLDNVLIVQAPNGNYGVVSLEGFEIMLETKYNSIEYLRNNEEFLVSSNGKYGIISKDRKTKFKPTYDSIKTIFNKDEAFYIVGKSGLYGLFDEEGKKIIYPEYEQIGIDVNAYYQNGVTNGEILYNQLIPVRRNDKWGIFDINKKKFIVDFIYDSFGCPIAPNNRSYGVLQIPEYNLTIVLKEGIYSLIDLNGKESKSTMEAVYVLVSEGEKIYYATINGETKQLLSVLQQEGFIQ